MRLRGKSILVLAGSLSLIAVADCGYDWTVVPSDDPDGVDTKTPDNNTSGSTSGKVPGKLATCTSSTDCGAGQYCAFADHKCGLGAKEGECDVLSSKEKCAGEASESVCGCNGSIFPSRCAAQTLGDIGEGCTTPADAFPCGFLFCNTKLQFCLETTRDGLADYQCVNWQCTAHDCTCPEVKCTCDVRKDSTVIVRCGS